jgi:hypothetical protein
MGENYDKWSVCDWKVRCWEQETTQVLPFGGEWMVESSCGVSRNVLKKSVSHPRVQLPYTGCAFPNSIPEMALLYLG